MKTLFNICNIKHLVIVTLFLTFSNAYQSEAEPLGELLSQNCSKRIDGHDVFSSDGRVRADNIVYCALPQGSGALLILRTAAMQDRRYRGGNHSPWIHLKLVNSSNQVLFENSNFALADVSSCGGYQQHVFRIPIPNGNDVFDVRIAMGGASPEQGACKPTATERLVRDLSTDVKRYINGEFTEAEQKAVTLLMSLL
jgi:hypothetical protein